MKLRKPKPKEHKVIKAWEEKGNICWLVPYDDFNRLYDKENVVCIDGKTCASITFANEPVIVFRDEKK